MNCAISSNRHRRLRRIAILILLAHGAIGLIAPSPARADLHHRVFVGTFLGNYAEVGDYFSISGSTANSTSSGSMYLEKAVAPRSSISIYAGLQRINTDGDGASGWDNVQLNFKQTLIWLERQEFVLSVGPSIAVPTGDRNVGAESHPREGFEMLFDKGFGDLPDAVAWLRPVAIEGGAAWQGKLTGAKDDLISGYLELEYSLGYLNDYAGGFHVMRELRGFTPHLDFDYSQYLAAHRNPTLPSFELTPGVAWLNSIFEVNIGAHFGVNGYASHPDAVALVWLLGVSYDELIPALKWTPFR